jgi:hypothetical protein
MILEGVKEDGSVNDTPIDPQTYGEELHQIFTVLDH